MLRFLLILFVPSCFISGTPTGVTLKSGDIIFQTSRSDQGKAIELATRSRYSHCGLIYKKGNEYLVYEAVQPVKITPLDQWVARGSGGHYAVKRLNNASAVLTPSALEKMKQAADRFTGKNYDIYFEWSDDKIYCSELVWKVYQRATGLEVGKLQRLRDFDLSSPLVKSILEQRYGSHIPLDENVISPAAIYNSPLLRTVAEHTR